ncbi:MAG: hypothetical protein K2I64_04320 [Muribaculaceae bacterium]|nr:hypothetical protein [Muribaculaceae bacterium]
MQDDTQPSPADPQAPGQTPEPAATPTSTPEHDARPAADDDTLPILRHRRPSIWD